MPSDLTKKNTMRELSSAEYAPPEQIEKSAIRVLSSLKSEFEKLVHAKLRLSTEFIRDAEELCSFLATRKILPKPFRETRFFGHLNWKFRLNADALATFFSRFAAHDYTFHYHQKRQIERGFNEGDWSLVISALEDRKTHQDAVDLARAIHPDISRKKSAFPTG